MQKRQWKPFLLGAILKKCNTTASFKVSMLVLKLFSLEKTIRSWLKKKFSIQQFEIATPPDVYFWPNFVAFTPLTWQKLILKYIKQEPELG